MPSQTEYILDKELDLELENALKSDAYFIPVIDNSIVNICYRVKLGEDGEPLECKGDPITIKKVAPDIKVFTRTSVDFVVIVDQGWWNDAADNLRRGTLTKLLMRIAIDKKEDGTVSKKLRPYDFCDFVANIRTNGTYDPILSTVKDVLTGKCFDMVEATLSRSQKAALPEDPEEDDEEEKPRVKAGPMPKPKRSTATA